ncbi:MAG: hypothetical protein GY818_16475 [Planctomycetaceae bacterium]|nr:hypothetical protein [Planctomycetaceae bacterium]
MPYSIEDEQLAQENLAQIWRGSNRKQKLALAKRFGYGGTDDSKLRVMRRLLTGSFNLGAKADVTKYFKPFVTNANEEAWLGTLPPYKLDTKAIIQSQVMYVTRDEYGSIAWEAPLPLSKKALGLPDNADVASKSIKKLFQDYSTVVKYSLGKYKGREDFNETGEEVVGMAFSMKGAKQLKKRLEDRYGAVIEIPAPRFSGYGITLVSTGSSYTKEGQPVPLVSKTYQRSFPKSKRDAMIRYTRHAYPQFIRPGGRLA